MRRRVVDGERLGGVLDEGNAEVRHRDVLGARELAARATRRAQRRRERLGAVRLDDRYVASRIEALQEIRRGRSDDRAADDHDIAPGAGHATKACSIMNWAVSAATRSPKVR
jgi:hypothetical protein